jgi:sugar-specific transcriptional regulator TrmB
MGEYEELGLTNNEGKVYQALIEHGKLGAGEISGKSGVSYSKIYNVLDSLILKGFVKVIPEKSKKFVPSDPDSLIKIIEERQKRLEEAKEKAKKMKEFYDIKEKNPVTLVYGKGGFSKVVKELKKTEKYEYTMKWNSDPKPEWIRDVKEDVKKGKDIRVLARYDEETENNIKEWLKINKNIRIFPNEGVAISIIDDSEVMLGIIRSNVTLLIKDRAFSKLMKNLFLEAYKNSEKIIK